MPRAASQNAYLHLVHIITMGRIETKLIMFTLPEEIVSLLMA